MKYIFLILLFLTSCSKIEIDDRIDVKDSTYITKQPFENNVVIEIDDQLDTIEINIIL